MSNTDTAEAKATKESVLAKYGEATIVFANLWELERVMSNDELEIARAIRHENTQKVIKFCR